MSQAPEQLEVQLDGMGSLRRSHYCGQVIPELEGLLDGLAMRVPVADGSVVDLTVELERDTSVEEINAAMRKAAEGPMRGILSYNEEPIVSTDIIGDSHSSIFDSLSTKTGNDDEYVKVVAWYDNEWGYSCRVVDLINRLAELEARNTSTCGACNCST